MIVMSPPLVASGNPVIVSMYTSSGLVDGVPVWQLSGPAPPDVRAAARSPLDHLKRALHTVVEQLESEEDCCCR